LLLLLTLLPHDSPGLPAQQRDIMQHLSSFQTDANEEPPEVNALGWIGQRISMEKTRYHIRMGPPR